MAAAKQSIAITIVSANRSANSLPPFERSGLRQLCPGVWQGVDNRRARWVNEDTNEVRSTFAAGSAIASRSQRQRVSSE
jgi:hypothetical protein